MELSMDVYEIRRKNLLSLIEQKYEGNRSNFARQVGKNVNTINLYLSNNESLRRNIGERNARELESAANVPTGWLDQATEGYQDRALVTKVERIGSTQRDPIDFAGSTLLINSKFLQVRYPDVEETELGFCTIVDDEMEPTLHRFDIVLINKAEKDITRSGLYLIWVGNNLKIRRLSQQLTGDILISCDNSKYPSISLSQKDHKQLKVVGRALGRLEHTPL